MAKFLKSFLDFMKLGGDDEDYDEDDDYYNDEEEEVTRKASLRSTNQTTDISRGSSSRRTVSSMEKEDNSEATRREHAIRTERTSSGKVIPLKTTARGMEVSIQKPTNFDDSEDICDMLIKGHPVVVNLEGFDPDDAQRIMDFLCGCIYAMDGKLNQISKYIFIFSPDGVDVSGDIPFDLNGVPTFNKEF